MKLSSMMSALIFVRQINEVIGKSNREYIGYYMTHVKSSAAIGQRNRWIIEIHPSFKVIHDSLVVQQTM